MSAAAPAPLGTLADGIPPEARVALMGAARPVTLAGGETLFRLGDEAQQLFVVTSGVLELTVEVPLAGALRRVVVEEVSAGEPVGWSALVPPHRYTLDAFAATDCTLLSWRGEELLATCSARPDVGNHLLRNLLTTVASRLHVLYAMWARELRRNLAREYSEPDSEANPPGGSGNDP